jgi:hypothetical protein
MAKAPIEIRSLARKYTEQAIETLVHVMREPKAPQASRVAAATALLDRGWGKPQQTTELTVKRVSANQLADDELADIAAGSSEGTAAPPLDPSQLN